MDGEGAAVTEPKICLDRRLISGEDLSEDYGFLHILMMRPHYGVDYGFCFVLFCSWGILGQLILLVSSLLMHFGKRFQAKFGGVGQLLRQEHMYVYISAEY